MEPAMEPLEDEDEDDDDDDDDWNCLCRRESEPAGVPGAVRLFVPAAVIRDSTTLGAAYVNLGPSLTEATTASGMLPPPSSSSSSSAGSIAL